MGLYGQTKKKQDFYMRLCKTDQRFKYEDIYMKI